MPDTTDKHPGGLDMTRQLLDLSNLSPCRILDMGAGDGKSLELLQSLGYDAWGIDLKPSEYFHSSKMFLGDFLNTPFSSKSFDAVLSECAFFISKHPQKALEEAHRLLKSKGKLLLADVCFSSQNEYLNLLENAGFSVMTQRDITPVWKEYYLSCIWDGTVSQLANCSPKQGYGKCSYYLTICERM